MAQRRRPDRLGGGGCLVMGAYHWLYDSSRREFKSNDGFQVGGGREHGNRIRVLCRVGVTFRFEKKNICRLAR